MMGTTQSLPSRRRIGDQRFTDVSKELNQLNSSLPLIVQAPLDNSSLQEAIKPIQHLVKDLPNQVAYSLERCKNSQDGLTQDESAAIFLYTQQWPNDQISFYTLFNRILRDADRTKLVPFQSYLNLLVSALNKLPALQGHVWRGTIGDYSPQYQLDTIHVWWGMSSCSDMVQVTSDFLDQTKHLTLFNIQCMHGKMIKKHSEFPNEDEIILSPGTFLKVKSSIKATHNLSIVYLEEIVPTSAVSTISNIYLLCLESDENKQAQERFKELFHDNFIPCEQVQEAVRYIEEKSEARLLLITNGHIGRQIVPKINHLSQVHSIMIYCMDKEAKEEWSRDYEKVKAVVSDIDQLIQKVQLLSNEPEEKRTLMHYLIDQPLLALSESLKEITALIPNLQKYTQVALSKSKNPPDGLTSNESAAIRISTMKWEPHESTLYCLLNKDLRSQSPDALRKWCPYLKLLLQALNKLPSYEGIVYRSLTVNIADQFAMGQTGTWRDISTGTSNMSILESSEYLGKTGSRTLLSIECKNGKCTRNHSSSEMEDEILLLPDFNFKVTKMFDPGDGLHIISLKENGITPEETTETSACILWLDLNTHTSNEHKQTQKKCKELFHAHFVSYEQVEKAVQYIEAEKNHCFLLIISGQIGRQIVSKLNNLSQIHFIVIYSINKEADERWLRNYEKVKAVITDSDQMIQKVQEFYEDLTEQDFGGIIHRSHPLHGLMDQPLLSLAESLQEISQLIPNLQNYIDTTLMNCMDPANDLTPNESAAIRIYTMEWEPKESCLSRLLNKDLRSKSRNTLKKWFPYLKLFLHALTKLPSCKGNVWYYSPDDLTRQFPDKQIGIWWTVLSNASNMSLGNDGIGTLFSIECTNGKRIAKHSCFPMADEILLLPGFSYEVTSQLDVGNGLHIIGLKEIDWPY